MTQGSELDSGCLSSKILSLGHETTHSIDFLGGGEINTMFL